MPPFTVSAPPVFRSENEAAGVAPPFVSAPVRRPPGAFVTTSKVVPATFVLLKVPAKFPNTFVPSFSVMLVPAFTASAPVVEIPDPTVCETLEPLFNVRFRAPKSSNPANGPATESAPDVALPKVRLVTPAPSRFRNSEARISSVAGRSTKSPLPIRMGWPAETGAIVTLCVIGAIGTAISIRSAFKTRFGADSAPVTVSSNAGPIVIVSVSPANTPAPIVTVPVSEISVTSPVGSAVTGNAPVSNVAFARKVTPPAVEVTGPSSNVCPAVERSAMSPVFNRPAKGTVRSPATLTTSITPPVAVPLTLTALASLTNAFPAVFPTTSEPTSVFNRASEVPTAPAPFKVNVAAVIVFKPPVTAPASVTLPAPVFNAPTSVVVAVFVRSRLAPPVTPERFNAPDWATNAVPAVMLSTKVVTVLGIRAAAAPMLNPPFNVNVKAPPTEDKGPNASAPVAALND